MLIQNKLIQKMSIRTGLLYPISFLLAADVFSQTAMMENDNAKRMLDESLFNSVNPIVVGTANDLKTNVFLYREFHYSFDAGKKYIVLYRDADGLVIAEKTLNYTGLETEPNLSQSNYVSGEKISVDTVSDALRIGIEYTENSSEKVESKTIKKPEQLVVDAGFNYFILSHWDLLKKDKSVRFQYLAPSQQTTFSFVAKKVVCDFLEQGLSEELSEEMIEDLKVERSQKSGGSSNQNNSLNISGEKNNYQCFSIAPKSWIMRQIVNPIRLVYGAQTKRLLRFTGLGNIGDKKGDYMKVDIRYEYPQDIAIVSSIFQR